ncbi:sulfurtransferase [Nocardia caishijiensis]|uniref:Rhodanese-like domain-containing protein n=1 Tax=Nocardia caishijiensis TaxID=184756 RepID=A0ABQ6YU21_9NOCA|nr:rhodanese-like domain-containing protein [Nocardia caishijiensis]KAF0849065.1 rhodanese-like domain-containing protein [Nocardia caishijiensis]
MPGDRAAHLVSAADLRDAPPARLVLLDVRTAGERANYQREHLPGARFADVDADLSGTPTADSGARPLPDTDHLTESLRRWGIHSDSAVVVYDDARSVAAARAWWVLRWAGLTDVRILDGGLRAWHAAGGRLTSGRPEEPPRTGDGQNDTRGNDRVHEPNTSGLPGARATPATSRTLGLTGTSRTQDPSRTPGTSGALNVPSTSGTFDAPNPSGTRGTSDASDASGTPVRSGHSDTAIARPGSLPTVETSTVAELPGRGILLDARPRTHFHGGGEYPGHIPGAISAPVFDDFDGDGLLLDEATLRARYRRLGVDAGTPAASYCGSAMAAALQVFVLATLGIEIAIYPGSLSQWVADPARPLATEPSVALSNS